MIFFLLEDLILNPAFALGIKKIITALKLPDPGTIHLLWKSFIDNMFAVPCANLSAGALEAWVREADSSGSEAGRQDNEEDLSAMSPINEAHSETKTADGANNVHFIVGGES